MWTTPEWTQRALNALRDALDVDTRLRHEMVHFLLDEGFWDSQKLSWEAALARFNSCLNPNRSEFFKLVEILALMQRFERTQMLAHLAAEMGFELRRIPTEERRQALLLRIAVATESYAAEIAAARAELATLTQPTLVRIDPSVREGRSAFSLIEEQEQNPRGTF